MTHPRSNSARDDFFSRYRRPGQGGVAKYAQLRDAIVTAIRAGHWKPGDRLPTEAELTQLTPFSLGTVQRALRALVDEGLVVRAQGSGSYVAESRGPIDVPLHLRFLGGPGEPRYLPLYPKVLGRRRIAARGPWSEWLGQTGDEIVCVDRRLGVNGEFDLYNRFYFSAASFPEIAGKPLAALDGANLKQLLGASFAMPITNVQQRVSIAAFPPEAIAALALPAGTRGLLLESAGSAGRGNPIYFLESFIPENARKLDVS